MIRFAAHPLLLSSSCLTAARLSRCSWISAQMLVWIRNPERAAKSLCGQITWSFRVWFSACAAASSRSLSLSLSCVFSKLLLKLFTSSLVSTLFWQFSKRDFCKTNKQTNDIYLLSSSCRTTATAKCSSAHISYLQAEVCRYKRTVHLVEALHGGRPGLHLWL